MSRRSTATGRGGRGGGFGGRGGAPAGPLPASTRVFMPAVRWAGSTVESIDSTETAALTGWVAEAAGLAAAPALAAIPVDTARSLPPRTDGFGAL